MVKKLNVFPYQCDSFGRGFLKMVILFVSFFLCSCSKDEVETKSERLFELQLGGKKYKFVNEWVSATEDCERLSVGVLIDQPYGHFAIDFSILKNGALAKASLVDYTMLGGDNDYETANFNPVALMKITNFKYDETKKYVHFDYSGELLKINRPENPDRIFPPKYIKGAVTITNLDEYKCNTFLPTARFETPTITFTGVRHYGTYDSGLSINRFTYLIYSNNGNRIFFKLKDDFWSFEIGKTYKFDQKTIENRIDFEQYIGRLRATQNLYNEQVDWKKFQTAGSYTILERKIVNGIKVTKGEMTIEVYDNGILVHTIQNGVFETSSF
jgi:hypothetical protein